MAANMTLQRPIFVVGCPRSGTTLVQCIISASDDAFSLPETHFYSEILPDLGLPLRAPLGPADLRRALGRLDYSAEMRLPDDLRAWLGEVVARGQLTPLALFETIVEQYRPVSDTGHRLRLVEKTPLHVLHLDQIGAAYPDACFVNVVRSPLDVTGSWRGTPFARTGSILFYARLWSHTIRSAEQYSRRSPGRLQTVVYERLVGDAESQVNRLCDFLDLPYTPRLLSEFGRQAGRNVNKREGWKQDIERGVIVNRRGNWRGRLTPGQAWLIALATRGVGQRYSFGTLPSATPAEIGRAIRQEVHVRFVEGRQTSGTWGSVRHALAGFNPLAGGGASI
jgi:hypothetical protein